MPEPPAVLRSVAPAVRSRIPALATSMVERIHGALPLYAEQRFVSTEALHRAAVDNIEYLLGTDGRAEGSDLAAARRTGVLRAERGAPLPEILAGFRIAFALFWETVADEAIRGGTATSRDLVELASYVFWKGDEYAAALTDAYRDTTAGLIRRHEQERSALVEALLTGSVDEHRSVWEIGAQLGLPGNGAFVVVVAEVAEAGRVALPGMSARLRAVDLSSAWRLLPDVEAGVVSLPGTDVGPLVRLLDRTATGRVGISPVYRALGDTPRSFYLARLALTSGRPGDAAVRRFEDSPIAALVAAAPEAAAQIARRVLGGILDLRAEDRAQLLDTVEAWFATGGSADATGARLFCHPNTVRHRLRRVAGHTGRDLRDPTALAELSAALHTVRLLPDLL